MQYITPEQEQEINAINDIRTSKHSHVAPSMPNKKLHTPESLQRRDVDIRDVSTVLSVGEFVRSRNYRVKGPVITRMMVEFFHEYLEQNNSIKRIAVIGFNSGNCALTTFNIRSYNRNLPYCQEGHSSCRF